MDARTLAYLFSVAPWVIGFVGLIGILWRLGKIARVLEEIRDKPPERSGDKSLYGRSTKIPGLND